ncbi:MAG TPA: ABC transporter ATP-binding protein [Dehalococcoidia bacterium]|jgi:glycerol transport system ATP-binding protein|nr:ABC transporter ATP-binding protein [Dehalococcoidia bacterium]
MLELREISRRVGGAVHLSGISLRLERGTLNVLLGPTLSGKTSLMRIMAGLDRPSSGAVLFDGKDVTGVPVARRNVAMVYQQFINYPGWKVRDNIASPLRVKRRPSAEVEREVKRVAELLRLTPYLDRRPLELSGGQQQRVALARALVKKADLVLLDEPLANLDYKLREELRAELPRLFADSRSVVIYATTEPTEALLLGGATATLSQGRITQFGRTPDVYRRPHDLVTARTFSDPPLNTLPAAGSGWAQAPQGAETLAFRPHHLRAGAGTTRALSFSVTVISTEITGSESFVHVSFGGQRWVMLSHGIHVYPADTRLDVHVEPEHVMAFDAAGRTLDPALREAA